MPPSAAWTLPGLSRWAPVKAPLRYPKSSDLEECLGKSGAVDRHHRPLGARARLVDGVGQKPLAGAALALDENGALTPSNGRNDVEELLDPGVGGHDRPPSGQPFDVEQQCAHEFEVTEGLNAADDLPDPVAQQRRGDGDRHAGAGRVPDLNREVDDRPAGFHRVPERAGIGADVRPEDLAAPLPDGILATDTQSPLRCRIEAGDPPIPIHGEDAVRDAVDDRFEAVVAGVLACSVEA